MLTRWVLLAGVVEYPIAKEVSKIFNDGAKIVKMSEFVVTNYSDERQIQRVINEIDRNFAQWMAEYKDGDEVYVALVGGNLQLSILLKRLERNNIDYSWLIYEKKLKRYVVIEERDGDVWVR